MVSVMSALLDCPVCYDKLKDPRMLPCQHIFCLNCLKALPRKVSSSFACPCCRREVDLPLRGEEGLPPSYLANQLIETMKQGSGDKPLCQDCEGQVIESAGFCTECSSHLCSDCIALHRRAKSLKGHEVITLAELAQRHADNPLMLRPIRRCTKHPHDKLAYYCDSHGTAVCRECLIVDHALCVRRTIEDAFREKMAPISQLVDEISRQEERLRSFLDALQTQSDHASASTQVTKTDLVLKFALLEKQLSERKRETELMLERQNGELQASIAESKKRVYADLGMVQQCLGSSRSLLEKNGLVQLLEGQQDMQRELDQVKTAVGSLEPPQCCHVLAAEEITPDNIVDEESLSVTDIVGRAVKIHGLPTAVFSGVASSFKVAIDFDLAGECMSLVEGLKHLFVVVATGRVGEKQPTTKTTCLDGGRLLKIDVTTHCEGVHHVYLATEVGADLGSSRASFTSRSVPQPGCLPRMIINGGGLMDSYIVAVNDQRGEVYVSEILHKLNARSGRVLAFSKSGDYLRDIFSSKTATVSGMDMHPSGVLVLALFQENRVFSLHPVSLEQKTIAEGGNRPGEVSNPEEITVLPSGDILVAEKGNSRVQCMSLHGTSRWVHSDPVWSEVVGVGLTADGTILTSDWSKMRVDKLVHNDDSWQVSPYCSSHNWKAPARFALHPSGCIVITEPKGKRITLLSPSGQVLTSVGREGKKRQPGEMSWPVGIACSSEGLIYVCDYSNHHVQVF